VVPGDDQGNPDDDEDRGPRPGHALVALVLGLEGSEAALVVAEGGERIKASRHVGEC
jgi:hypothetical protein